AGMAYQVVRRADQLVGGETRDTDEDRVAAADHPAPVGRREEELVRADDPFGSSGSHVHLPRWSTSEGSLEHQVAAPVCGPRISSGPGPPCARTSARGWGTR